MPAAATASAIARCRSGGCIPRLTQWLAVTGRSNPVAVTTAARSPSPSTRGVERLVGVQVDADAVVGGDRRGTSPSPLGSRPVEVRATADEVGTGRQRVAEQGPLVGAAGPGDRPRAQGDDLDVDHVGDAATHLGERFDAGQPLSSVVSACVRTATEAVAGHQAGRPLGALDDVGDVAAAPGSSIIAAIAPSRSPDGFARRSARNALSRWACGSTAAGQQDVAGEVVLVVVGLTARHPRRR